MAKRAQYQWGTDLISPLQIDLDRLNPRIKVQPEDTEADIIEKLIRYEEVGDLAGKIARQGLLPGERIIVVKEKGRYVVLVGNRRVCACKLLLTPSLIPQKYQKSFPKLANATEIGRITKVAVDIAPTRRDAEHVLTIRHTEPGIRRWRPVAKMRRALRLQREGFSVEEIAAELKASPGPFGKSSASIICSTTLSRYFPLLRVNGPCLKSPI
jgi:hypothetical protein